jgi:hypothetical protein
MAGYNFVILLTKKKHFYWQFDNHVTDCSFILCSLRTDQDNQTISRSSDITN